MICVNLTETNLQQWGNMSAVFHRFGIYHILLITINNLKHWNKSTNVANSCSCTSCSSTLDHVLVKWCHTKYVTYSNCVFSYINLNHGFVK